MAYRQFLTSNGISHDHVEEAEYGHVLESQKLVGQDLDRLTDTSAARDVSLTVVLAFRYCSMVLYNVTKLLLPRLAQVNKHQYATNQFIS